MFIFGVDIPLIEVLIGMLIVIFFLLAESIVLIVMLLKALNKAKDDEFSGKKK